MKMTGNYKWLKDLKDADFMYGGEQFVITEEDIERLKKGEVLNFFVNMEYGCTLSYTPTSKRDMLAKKNKCKPEQVTCLNCYYKWGDKYFCNYHRCGLLNVDEPCYKFKYCIR